MFDSYWEINEDYSGNFTNILTISYQIILKLLPILKWFKTYSKLIHISKGNM